MKRSNQWVVVGAYVDDSIEQAYSQLKELNGVRLFPKHKAWMQWIYKKCLGLSRHYLGIDKAGEPDFLGKLICHAEVKDANLEQGKQYHFLLIESPQAINASYVTELRTLFPDSTFTLLLVNALKEYELLSKWIDLVEPLYNQIVSCNKSDAEQRGWLYHADCYTPLSLVREKDDLDIDVLFLGADKGRAGFAHEIYEQLKKHHLYCQFLIVGKPNPQYEDAGFRYLSKPIPYAEYLKMVARSRCLLEIVANGQDFCTLRTMEALSYGKLLLSTNKCLPNEPFYRPEQMAVIGSSGKIDSDFFRLEIKDISANSDNPFLPEHLLKYLEEELMA